MNPRVIQDIEESLKREIARIYTHNNTTKTQTDLPTSYDVFTGKPKSIPLTAHFYDENASPNQVQYPRVDITFEIVQEDKTSGRMLSLWEYYAGSIREIIEPNTDRPVVYERVESGTDGVNQGSYLQIPRIKYNRVSVGNLIKIVSGTNQGTYKVKALDNTNHRLQLESDLILNIQEVSFNPNINKLYLLNPTEMHTLRVGDFFTDASSVAFKIIDIRPKQRELYLEVGVTAPDLSVGSKITRVGSVLKNLDSGNINYIVMDATKPLVMYADAPTTYSTDQNLTSLQLTPFNYYFNIEITNKERPPHIAMAERMTETVINRPRRAIKMLLRTEDSAESNITERPQLYYSNTIVVKSAEHFTVNDSVYLINKLEISDNNQIIDIDYETNTITLRNPVTLDYSLEHEASLISAAEVRYWTFYLDGDVIMGSGITQSFWRQNYSFKVEGWKNEKSGKKANNLISTIHATLETPNHLIEDIDVE